MYAIRSYYERVLELAHIAREAVAEQRLLRGLGQARQQRVLLGGEALQDVVRQHQHIFAAVSQRRDL